MDLPVLIETLLRLGGLLAGLLLPGSMLLRALRIPWSLAAAFLISSATLYVIILIFACTGCPISPVTLGLALGVISLAGFLVPSRGETVVSNFSFACFSQMGTWTPLYLVFWAIVCYRLFTQPLSGPDVYFRWSYLAEQMLRFGSLDFYPPRSGVDFARYFWAESVPPGIASLYAWAYACGGNTHALWTSPVIALQLLSLHDIVWRLGFRLGGRPVARHAVLLAAASPLLTWSFLIGQETGLTAVAVCGLVWCLYQLREEGGSNWAVLAGIFSVAAASTREYGLVFPFAAIAAALFLQIPRRSIAIFALLALPVTVAWPLHVWVMTGNPFYSLALGGLFPVNLVFTAWNDSFRAQHGFNLLSSGDWFALGRYGLLWALPSAAGLVAMIWLLIRNFRTVYLAAYFCLLVFMLWFASTSYTAGGLYYSLRLLSPALALLVVATSYQLTSVASRHPQGLFCLSAVVLLVMAESFPKTLTLPANPYWTERRDWLDAGAQFATAIKADDQELLALLMPLPGRKRVATDHAGMPRLLATIGTEALPFWSPDVQWFFDGRLRPEEAARRWLKSGLRYFIVSRSGASADFFRAHARNNAPYFTFTIVASTRSQLILEVGATADERF